MGLASVIRQRGNSLVNMNSIVQWGAEIYGKWLVKACVCLFIYFCVHVWAGRFVFASDIENLSVIVSIIKNQDIVLSV